MLEILTALIIEKCKTDQNLYYVQDYKESCQIYYVNCLIGESGEINEKTLQRCEDEKFQNTHTFSRFE